MCIRDSSNSAPQKANRSSPNRKWVSPALGLRDEVSDLVVLSWAALRQRAWYHHGGPIAPPKPGQARPELELRPEPLPAATDWDIAVARAGALFGITGNHYLTAPSVAQLTEQVREQATQALPSVARQGRGHRW